MFGACERIWRLQRIDISHKAQSSVETSAPIPRTKGAGEMSAWGYWTVGLIFGVVFYGGLAALWAWLVGPPVAIIFLVTWCALDSARDFRKSCMEEDGFDGKPHKDSD
jgi:hypothetical protein